MSDSDDLPGEPELGELEDELSRHRKALYELVSQYMEEAEIDEAFTVQLLLDGAVSMRMAAYGMSVENPSVAGLRLDLDRLRREVDEFIREAKKGAEGFIRKAKEMRAAMEEEDEEGEE